MDEKFAALSRLLKGQANSDDLDLLRRALTRGEISVGGDVNHSVIIIGSGNTVTLTAEARQLLQPEEVKDEPAPGEPPYKGLLYFDVADAPLFFGREVLTRDLTARLKREPLLAIVGASGSGKSSLARAGLVPTWREEHAGQVDVHIITPSAHPLESLATSLTRDSESVTAAETLAADLRQSPRSLRLYARRLLQQGKPRLLLLIDQFEETFTLCKDADERQAFIENLLELAEDAGEEVRVLLTLRADFYHHCADYEGLRRALQDHQAFIGAMNREELRRAILSPAKAGDWEFQPGLVELMLNDAGDEPGTLPLLSHALLETWKRRRGRTLTLQGYAESGGVKQAIARTAERVYARLSEEERRLARVIFLRLTELGEDAPDTRRRATFSELSIPNSNAETVKRVLNILTEARLLTISQEGVEVAHEALIREWETLRRWLDEDRKALWTQRHLTEAALEWERSGRNETFLVHRAGRLEDALVLRRHPFLHLSKTEDSYLIACLNLQERQRKERECRQRLTIFISIVVAMFFFFLSIFAQRQSQIASTRTNDALTAQAEAEQNFSIAQTAQAQEYIQHLVTLSNLLIQQNPVHSTLFAIEAAKNDRNDSGNLISSQVYQALVNSVASLTAIQAKSRLLSGHQKNVTLLLFSPDSRWLLSGSDDQITLWDMSASEFSSRPLIRNVEPVDATFIGFGKGVAVGTKKGDVYVWMLNNLSNPTILPGNLVESSFNCSVNNLFVYNVKENTLSLWKIDENAQKLEDFQEHQDKIKDIKVRKDCSYLASIGFDSSIRIWDIESKEESPKVLNLSDEYIYPTSLAFSDNLKWMAVGSIDRRVYLWDMTNLDKSPAIFEGFTNDVSVVAFSKDSRRLLGADWDGRIHVWDLNNPTNPPVSYRASQGVIDIRINPDNNKLVASVWAENFVLRGDLPDMHLKTMDFSSDALHVLDISPNQKWLAISDGNMIYLEDMRHVVGSPIPQKYCSDINDIKFSTDGKWLAVSYGSDIPGETCRGTSLLHPRDFQSSAVEIDAHSISGNVAFSPDNKWLVTGGYDTDIVLWDLSTLSPSPRLLAEYAHEAQPMEFSPDGKWLIVNEALWTIPELNLYSLFSHSVTSAAFDVNSERLIVGSEDGSVIVWDLNLSKSTDTLFCSDSEISAMSFSPDLKWLVVGNVNGDVCIWQMPIIQERPIVLRSGIGYLYALEFTPDSGNLIAAGSQEPFLAIWQIDSLEQPTYLSGHTEPVISIDISQSGTWLATGGRDNTVRLWNLKKLGENIVLKGHYETVSNVKFSPDEKWLVTGGFDNLVLFWAIHPDDLINLGCQLAGRDLTVAEWQSYLSQDIYSPICFP